jgi:hypothetical protein
VQKALAGLRRINLDGLRWCVFDAKGQVRDSSTDFICRMDELIRKKKCKLYAWFVCDRCLDDWHPKLLLRFKAKISQLMHHM